LIIYLPAMAQQHAGVGEQWDLAGKVAVVTGGSSGTTALPPFQPGGEAFPTRA
jgi:hypothetical protein